VDYVVNGKEIKRMTNNNGGFYFSEEIGFKPKIKKPSKDTKKGEKKDNGKKEEKPKK
jgi:hypothetical protein